MRPVPRSRHFVAVLIFAAVSVAFGCAAFFDNHLSESQMNIASSAMKRHRPGLYPHDPVFGPSELWRFQTPSAQVLLELILVPTDYEDLTLPFRLLTAPVVMIYLCGMYALLYRQCRSWSMSAFVAILSCKIAWTIGWSHWGVGSLASISPQAFMQAAVPLIVLAFLRYIDRKHVLLVFLAIGICGNLHLVTAMNLTGVLLIVYLARRKFHPSSWPMALAGGLSALAGASLYVGYHFGLRMRLGAGSATPDPAIVFEALRIGGLESFYPDLLKGLLRWLLWVAVLVVPAVAVLSRMERFRVRDLGVWVWFIVGGLWIALGLQGVSQLAGTWTGRFPPVIDFSQAASLVMLPLYALFAQALTNLFRVARRQHRLLQWICAALMIAWMLPSDNLRFVRRQAYALAASVLGEENRPRKFAKLQERRERRREMVAIAEWARWEDHTPIDAVFLTGSLEFRMHARRSIVASTDDVKYVFYLAPWRLEEWTHRVRRLARVLNTGPRFADTEQIARFAGDLAARDEFDEDAPWYVILHASIAPDRQGVLEEVPSDQWGDHYRLYRVTDVTPSQRPE